MNEKDKTPHHYWLYVLECEDSKYYVGVTSKTPQERFNEHVKGIRSAKWTMKYKPIKLIDQKDLGMKTYTDAEKYENKVIRAYIKKVGVNNARGGDLRDPEDYIIRFGYIWPKEVWGIMISVIALMIIITTLCAMYYLKK